jgi:hypothetical protein
MSSNSRSCDSIRPAAELDCGDSGVFEFQGLIARNLQKPAGPSTFHTVATELSKRELAGFVALIGLQIRFSRQSRAGRPSFSAMKRSCHSAFLQLPFS